MEKELADVTEIVMSEKRKIELLFDKLNQTRRGFSITCGALADRLQLEVDDEYFVDFVKETSEEIKDIDDLIISMREDRNLDETLQKSISKPLSQKHDIVDKKSQTVS